MLDVSVPVVGGQGGATSLPLLSKMRPHATFTRQEVAELTTAVRNAGTEVAEAKGGFGSATLSAAYAAARFIESSLRALDGEEDVYECAFVESSVTELPFFASRVKLGKGGVETVVGSDMEGMTAFEEATLEALKPVLKARIEKGLAAATCL